MVDFSIGEPYLSELGKNLDGLKNKVHEMGQILDMANVKERAEKAAFIMAADDLLGGEEGQAISTKVLIQAAVRACEKTGEYDYPLFIGRLISAIMKNGPGLFGFNIANKSIKVNLTPLGHAAQWIAAANAVRLRFAIGKSRLAKKPIDGMEPRYKFWMEKIYKPAREGIPVPEKKKKVPQVFPKLDKMWGKPKVSADQKAKYDKVIKARLAQFSMKEAPFWEVINNGNATVGYGGSSAPYPLFGPTNFVYEASEILTSMLRTSIAIYRPKAEEALLKSIVKDGGMERKGPVPTPDDVRGAIRDMVQWDVNRIRLGKEPMPPGKQTISITRAIDVTYEVYATSLGNVFVRARGKGGRFIKSLLEIK